jgi:hypothetical protein
MVLKDRRLKLSKVANAVGVQYSNPEFGMKPGSTTIPLKQNCNPYSNRQNVVARLQRKQ